LPTALDLGRDDLDGQGRLTVAAAALGDACGLLVAPGGARDAAARRSSGRVLMLPTLLTRPRAAALRDVRRPTELGATRVIGWRLGHAAQEVPEYATAVAEGIARYLTESRDRVAIVGEAEYVPAPLRGHDRVEIVADRELDAEVIAGWSAHVWTPALIGDDIVDDARVLEEAGCAGVPSVMPAGASGGVDGYLSSHVLVQAVDDPQLWYDVVHHVLDDPNVHSRRSEEAWRRADAVDGPAASKAVVSRLMGWASFKSVPT
jgi:hypothetical protein